MGKVDSLWASEFVLNPLVDVCFPKDSEPVEATLF